MYKTAVYTHVLMCSFVDSLCYQAADVMSRSLLKAVAGTIIIVLRQIVYKGRHHRTEQQIASKPKGAFPLRLRSAALRFAALRCDSQR